MPQQDSLVGTVLGNFFIEGELGRGGMGVVYKARQQSLNRTVAIKVLPPHLAHDEGFVKRFLREARIAAELNHPNVVTIHDVSQHGDHYYIVMEFIQGAPFSKLLERGPLDPKRALHVVNQVALALVAAHSRTIIHRDIKPENIMVDVEGRVKVTDFGLAKALSSGSNLTATGAFLGTPLYMSPEQCEAKDLNTRSDIYSLGVVLFQALVGRPPFNADTPLVLMRQIVDEPFPPPSSIRPNLPESIDRLVMKMVAKDPSRRYISAEAVVKDIAKCADEVERSASSVSAPGKSVSPAPSVSPPPQWSSPTPAKSESATQVIPSHPPLLKSPKLWGALAAAVVLVASAAIAFTVMGRNGEAHTVISASEALIIHASDMPFEPGWNLRMRNVETKEYLHFKQVSRTNKHGNDYYTIETPYGKVFHSMKGNRLYEYIQFADEVPVAVLQFPLEVGKRWSADFITSRLKKNDVHVQHYRVDADEVLDTPYGMIRALRILHGTEPDLVDSPETLARWYAPKLGLVKLRIKLPDEWVTAEIDALELGPPPKLSPVKATIIRGFGPSMSGGLVIQASDIPLAVWTRVTMRTIGNPDWNVHFEQHDYTDKGGDRFYSVTTPWGWIYYCMRDDGLYEYLWFDDELPETFVPFPLAVGMKWSIAASTGRLGETKKRYFHADIEEVLETEAGTMRTIRIVTGYDPATEYTDESAVRWYAKGKGLVKINARPPGGNLYRWEIISFTYEKRHV